jgi:putative CocE/NonD family hydrolase
MTVVTDFPKKLREIETLWVPLADGTRLAARVWMPEGAERDPVPAILEYIPYRRRDGTRDGDDLTHPYFAGHGYACIRLDIRGSGDSDGLILDEYLKQEQDDAVEAIAWIARQPWCTGKVGMMGISWGGFNALQVAARNPPALKAIITVDSTDDRYADDMHYMGGQLINGNLEWGASFFSRAGRAPDPLIVGERWRQMWLDRLEHVEPFHELWLRHPWRDDFWRHGSVCEDFDRITCAVFAVGGWADGYSNAIFRLLWGLKAPRLGLCGPWGHKYPHTGVPGPAIGFLQEALRWWDHWLKGRDTGIMAEPMLRAYVQDSIAPKSHYDLRPGRWVAEREWPSPRLRPTRLICGAGRLTTSAPNEGEASLSSPQTTGGLSGEWCPYGLGGLGPELPMDQREDDANSLSWDSAPLEEAMEILGAPVVTLTLSADRPVAMIAIRLCDVAPAGASTRVTYGVLNLTHRESHAAPKPLVPGEFYRVTLQLNDCGHRFAAGHRLRLAVSTAYWPTVWPSPEPVTITVRDGQSHIDLPVRAPGPEDAAVRFEPAVTAAPTRRRWIRPGSVKRTLERDVETGETLITVTRDDGLSEIEAIGTVTGLSKTLRYWMAPDDPASARAAAEHEFVNQRKDWNTRVTTRTSVACDREYFYVEADLEAFEEDRRVFARSWNRRVPRQLG